MNNEYKVEDIDPILDLKNKVLQILDLFRGSINSENYPMILFLLSLQKEGVLDKIEISNHEEFGFQLFYAIKNFESDSSESYKILYKEFEPYLSPISEDKFSQIILSLRDLNQIILKEHFSIIFEDLFYQLLKSKGRSGGESLMPMELCRFMCSMAELPVNAKIYNPFAGLASFGVFLNEAHDYFGQELTKLTWALGGLRLAANDRSGITTFSNDDSILYWPSNDQKFDLIITNPPFGLRLNQTYKNLYPTISTIEQFLVEKGISSLNDTGKLITVLPNGFLFRGGAEKKTREFLIKADLIESIISIPGGLYSNTLIPVVVLVINKSKKEKGIIRFIDANNCVENSNKREKKLNDYALNSIARSSKETDSLRFVSNETVMANDYNLNVARYFGVQYVGVRLGDLVSEIRNQNINELIKQKGKLIRNRDLKSHPIDFSLDINNIGDVELPRHKTPIYESCLLLTTRDKHIKPTFFEYKKTPIYLNKGIHAFKVDNSKIDLEYLISELNSDYVIEQLKAFYSGSVLPVIDQNDLLNIIIHVPSFEEQKATVIGIKQYFNEDRKKELEYQQELLVLKEESFREFASIKHTFRQYLNALKSNVAGTRLFVLNNQENSITLDTIYSKNLNKTFGEHLSGLEGTINSMSKLLTSFESSTKDNIVKEHDLKQLVEEAQNRFKNSELFQFEKVYFDEDSFAFEYIDDSFRTPITSIDEDDFYRVFSNIVSNAIDHGFKDISKKYSIRTSIIFDEKERMCILEVSNNGKAMPKDFTLKDLTTSGEKTTDSKGTGMGGADIKNILKKYNGTLDIINDQTQEFPVTYIVKLPLFTITL